MAVRAAILLTADIVAVRHRDAEAPEAAVRVNEGALRRHVGLGAMLVASVARLRGGGSDG